MKPDVCCHNNPHSKSSTIVLSKQCMGGGEVTDDLMPMQMAMPLNTSRVIDLRLTKVGRLCVVSEIIYSATRM